MPEEVNLTDSDKERIWANDEQAAKIEFLEQTVRDIALQFDNLLKNMVDLQMTCKKISTVSIQLMRGMKELDETCVRKPLVSE